MSNVVAIGLVSSLRPCLDQWIIVDHGHGSSCGESHCSFVCKAVETCAKQHGKSMTYQAKHNEKEIALEPDEQPVPAVEQLVIQYPVSEWVPAPRLYYAEISQTDTELANAKVPNEEHKQIHTEVKQMVDNILEHRPDMILLGHSGYHDLLVRGHSLMGMMKQIATSVGNGEAPDMKVFFERRYALANDVMLMPQRVCDDGST